MKKLKIYLDTSIINFLFAEDAPEKQEVTIDFFEGCVKKRLYDIFISPIVIDEINKTSDENQKSKLLETISSYQLAILDIESEKTEIVRLSQIYIEKKIIPQRKLEDALHIAITTVYEMDILLSWNYRHLANVNKERKILIENFQEGYIKPFRLITPMEVAYE
ncbi:MAG: type II toxin-antitoxin system VapC family toxin [Candidatus Brocadiae bacterium]|nr:type II toxin-antitoxin system VapC family toxin [Candidatus Brocadiia bacterium]